MPNITLSISDDVHRFIKEHKDIRWSELARKAFAERIERERQLEWMDKVFAKSTLTPEDVREIEKKVKEGMRKRFMDEIGDRHQHRHKRGNS